MSMNTADPCSICKYYSTEDGFMCDFNETCPVAGGTSMITATIKAVDCSAQIGTSCQICDSFIPIINIKYEYPRICDECKKRLKKLLYESPKEW